MEIKIQRVRQISPQSLSELPSLLGGGVSVAEIASRWQVSKDGVYYWIYKGKLSLKEIRKRKIKKIIKDDNPKKNKYLYHYFVRQAMRRGEFNNAEGRRVLNLFYQNRNRFPTKNISYPQAIS